MLDTAQKLGFLDHMSIPSDLACGYVETLFSGVQPSAIGFDRPTSFKHYLACLHSQVALARGTTFEEAVRLHAAHLDDANARLEDLHAKRIRGQGREFKDIIDPQQQALSIIEFLRGPTLERAWQSLAP